MCSRHCFFFFSHRVSQLSKNATGRGNTDILILRTNKRDDNAGLTIIQAAEYATSLFSVVPWKNLRMKNIFIVFIVGKSSSASLRAMRSLFSRQTGLLNKKEQNQKCKKEGNYAGTSNGFHFQIFQGIRAAYSTRLNSICSRFFLFPLVADNSFFKHRSGKPDRRHNFHFGNLQCSFPSAPLDLRCKVK